MTSPSTQDNPAGPAAGDRPWPFSVLSDHIITEIRRIVATWPPPGPAQIDAVAALRPARKPR